MAAVGYGDLNVKYQSTILFESIYIIICVGFFATAGSNIVDYYYFTRDQDNLSEFHKALSAKDADGDVSLTPTWIKQMLDLPNAVSMSTEQLVLEVLIRKQVIDRLRDVTPILLVS